MKRTTRGKAFVLTAIALMTLAAAAAGVFSHRGSAEGTTVRRVFDGDSILLVDGREIRYIGIDAPETGTIKPTEYRGRESRELNEGLVDSREVSLEFDRELRDTYGRTLAYVFVGDKMVNREMVLSGEALAVPYPPNLKHQAQLRDAMEQARHARRGLWADPERWMVSSDDAGRFVGESKTVVGRVASTGEIGRGIFLNFGPDYRTDFTAFIPRDDLSYFTAAGITDPARYYGGRTVEVTGPLHEKNGPSITVRHPDQIYVRP